MKKDETNCYYLDDSYEFVPFRRYHHEWVYRLCGWIYLNLITAVCLLALFVNVVGLPAQLALEETNDRLVHRFVETDESLATLEETVAAIHEKDRTLYRSVLDLEPVDPQQVEDGRGGVDPYADLDLYTDRASSLVRTTVRRLTDLERSMNLQAASMEELISEDRNLETKLRQLPAMKPVDGIILSEYGVRNHPVLNVRRMHRGLDFRARTGTPVYATGDGVVRRASRYGNYGLVVIIDHDYGYQTWYAHLSSFADSVRPGETVRRGQKIAYSGNTGLTQGPHLHYEVRHNGQSVDPVRYMLQGTTPSEFNLHKRSYQ